MHRKLKLSFAGIFLVVTSAAICFSQSLHSKIGQEVAVPIHLKDGEEAKLPISQLIDYGKQLFTAAWTSQEGAGRPMSKGTGLPLSDPNRALLFPRNFNRISGPGFQLLLRLPQQTLYRRRRYYCQRFCSRSAV